MPRSFPTRRSSDLAFGLTARYAVFVILYNWGQAVLLLSILPVLALAAAGLLPAAVPQGWSLLLLLFWLFAVTRMARVGLGAPLGAAVLAGLLDPAVTELLHRLVDRSEEHTSELQSLMRISYAVFCLKKTIKDIDQVYSRAHYSHD